MTAFLLYMVPPSRCRLTTALIVLLAILPTVVAANDATGSAYDFVKEWNKAYGIDHARAAAMMTKNYRGGLSEDEWVALYAPYLEQVQYQHLGGELIRAQEEQHKAQVILKSSVNSIQGPMVQHEIYDLVRVDGRWLIDFIHIHDENFSVAIEPEPTQGIDSKHHKPSP